MSDLEKLQAGLLAAAAILAAIAVGIGWLAYAEHPSATNLRRAMLLTLKQM